MCFLLKNCSKKTIFEDINFKKITMKHFYFLLFTFFALNLSFGQVIITELADPENDASARFVEIYNISNADVDLTGWELRRWTNGNTDPQGTGVDLSSVGTLASGAFAVIANNANFESVYGFAPDIIAGTGGAADSNGDDQIALYDPADNTIDFFGVIGEDGSNTCHEFEDGRAERIASVTSGTSTWNEAEWNVWSDFSSASGCTNHNSSSDRNAPDDFDPGSWIGASSTTTISISSPSNNNVFNPGTSSVPVLWATNNAPTGASVNIVVDGTETSGVSSPYTINTTDGTTYSVTVNLVDGGSTVATDNVSFSVGSYTQVNDIAALRAGTEGNFYELSGEAFISYIVTDNTRNQKYIQDQSGGILIDDSAGTLSTVFNIGDGISGLRGELGGYAGVSQFVPTENVASASSTGNTITPQTITIADFILAANADLYESQLIRFDNVTFSDTGAFEHNQNYSISQGTDATTARVTFEDEDLIGASIPSASDYVIGLAAEFNGSLQILPRYMSDVQGALTTDDYRVLSFEMYPNPTNTGFVTIKSNQMGAVQSQVFDLLGKEVINTTVNNERMDVSNLNAGVYVVKLTQNKNTTTKKLIIQ